MIKENTGKSQIGIDMQEWAKKERAKNKKEWITDKKEEEDNIKVPELPNMLSVNKYHMLCIFLILLLLAIALFRMVGMYNDVTNAYNLCMTAPLPSLGVFG